MSIIENVLSVLSFASLQYLFCGWLCSCCLVICDLTGSFRLLRYFSDVVWYPRDLRVKHRARFGACKTCLPPLIKSLQTVPGRYFCCGSSKLQKLQRQKVQMKISANGLGHMHKMYAKP